MATLHLKNFGPIKDSTRIVLTPFVLLLGPQSSGKSSFMKVFSYCRWIEKKAMTSYEDVLKHFKSNDNFINELKKFHRLDGGFFNERTGITYNGDYIDIKYSGKSGTTSITKRKDFNGAPYNSKISYIPAERNLVSALRDVTKTYKTTEIDNVFNFIREWEEAKRNYTADKPFNLSLPGAYKYINVSGEDMISLDGTTMISSFYASSGVQSIMPVDVMTSHYMGMVGKTANFSIKDLFQQGDSTKTPDRLIYQSTQLFIEEPEQNLFPETQKTLVFNICRKLNEALAKGRKQSSVFITTHSPYILSVINVLMRYSESIGDYPELGANLDKSVLLPAGSYSAYYIDDGKFKNILDSEIPMFGGNDLDGISDWVDECIDKLNLAIYG